MRALSRSYEALVKDKEIIAAEVMHEYNQGVCHYLSIYHSSCILKQLSTVRLPSREPNSQRRRRHDTSGGNGQRVGGLNRSLVV